MGLIRLVTIALIVWLVWRMIKNHQHKKAQRQRNKKGAAKNKMVQCQFCSVHLPQSEALQADNHWFCHQQHQQLYIEKQQ